MPGMPPCPPSDTFQQPARAAPLARPPAGVPGGTKWMTMDILRVLRGAWARREIRVIGLKERPGSGIYTAAVLAFGSWHSGLKGAWLGLAQVRHKRDRRNEEKRTPRKWLGKMVRREGLEPTTR